METPGSQSALRATNRRRVLEQIVQAGALTQAEIARQTGLSPATVSNIVRSLATANLLDLEPTVSSGRRAQLVRMSRRAGLAAGIDFGRTHVRLAVAGLSHEILVEREVPVRRGYPASEGVTTASRVFDEMLAEIGATREAIRGLGVGIPGPIDSRSGLVGSGSILPEWIGEPVQELVESCFAMPVLIENDANLGALAESTWGAGKDVDDLVYLKVSTGIGAGLVLGGRLFRGGSGTAGEIGHTTVNTMGPVCRCGNRGCLELEAAVPVILERLAASHGREVSIEEVGTLLAAGDVPTHRVVESAGHALGVAVADLCNLLNPSVIVVGGDFARADEVLLRSMREVVRRVAVPSAGDHVRLAVSTLGNRAQVLGALGLVYQSNNDITVGLDQLSSLG